MCSELFDVKDHVGLEITDRRQGRAVGDTKWQCCESLGMLLNDSVNYSVFDIEVSRMLKIHPAQSVLETRFPVCQ